VIVDVVTLRSPRRFVCAGAAALLGAALAACSSPYDAPQPIAVAIERPAAPAAATIAVTGLGRDERAALASSMSDAAAWERVIRVAVDGTADSAPAVAGTYAITDRGVRFTPAFPLEAGRLYDVRVNLTGLRSGLPAELRTSLGLPALPAPTAQTRVLGVSPAGATVPENLLRIYVWFSAPMAREDGRPHVALFDELSGEVKDAFLPIDGAFWNDERTRYTLFFDPGRVKDDILPNRHMGRPLVAGRRYRLAIAPAWRDARGAPLVAAFEHRFQAVAAAKAGLDIGSWQVAAPRAGSRDPLIVTFPAALDRALALRTIGVETAGGAAVDGDTSLDPGDTRWQLVPHAPWTAGAHRVVALDALEDPAGNRLGRAFEVTIDDTRAEPPPRVTRGFTIAP
jgi:hypothetical protein